MKPAFVFLTLLICIHSFAQKDEADVKKTIAGLFEGMRKSHTGRIRSAFTHESILQTVFKDKEGNISVRTESLDSFIASVVRPHKEIYDERIRFDLNRVDGALAIAWTPYTFYLTGKFSHCGTDSYQLVKLNGQWKIQYLIDTRRKQNGE
jgi:hypothetical protein